MADAQRFVEGALEFARDDEADWSGSVPFFADHPHLLMTLGFDEYWVVPRDDAKAVGTFVPGASFDFRSESFFRQAASGVWYWYEGILGPGFRGSPDLRDLALHLRSSEVWYRLGLDEWISKVEDAVRSPDPIPRLIVPRTAWTLGVQARQEVGLVSSTARLLEAIQAEDLDLRAVPWRQLEELVAELLRRAGLSVYVTPAARDGGRDVVARGELIPGEPMEIAVEVKQRDVVGLHDVRAAVAANGAYPGLLIATAGRFSAGVVDERERLDRRLRLYLKDGIALKQWIARFGFGSNQGKPQAG